MARIQNISDENASAKDMETIRAYLKRRAIPYGLHWEVLCWAFYAMRSNPQLTIAQALEEGCREWDV